MDRMRTLSVKYPGYLTATINVSPETFEEEAKMAMAVNLYELGKLVVHSINLLYIETIITH